MVEPPILDQSGYSEKIKACIFSIIMLFSAIFGSIYFLMPLVPLIFIRPRVFRLVIDYLVGFWLVMPSGFMEYMFGVRIFVSGDVIDNSKPALIIMNHRTRLDWLFFWNALFRIDPWLLTTEKISLKGILKYLPGAGWAMASNAFMFLDRTFAKDKPRINSLIEYYKNSGNNYQLLLFPEGTDKCPLATERSKLFAEKNELIHYDYVLHPRTTGFVYILQKMKQVKYVKYIYDVTVAYSDAIVQSELHLVTLGLTPKNVHFDIRKIDISELPDSDEELDIWLKNLWKEKEERLKRFYGQTRVDRRLDVRAGGKNFEFTPLNQLLQLFIIFTWLSLTLCWVYLFYTFSYQSLLALSTVVFFVGAQYLYGGVEMIMTHQFRQHELRNGRICNSDVKME